VATRCETSCKGRCEVRPALVANRRAWQPRIRFKPEGLRLQRRFFASCGKTRKRRKTICALQLVAEVVIGKVRAQLKFWRRASGHTVSLRRLCPRNGAGWGRRHGDLIIWDWRVFTSMHWRGATLLLWPANADTLSGCYDSECASRRWIRSRPLPPSKNQTQLTLNTSSLCKREPGRTQPTAKRLKCGKFRPNAYTRYSGKRSRERRFLGSACGTLADDGWCKVESTTPKTGVC
jgi:hypothetical protein